MSALASNNVPTIQDDMVAAAVTAVPEIKIPLEESQAVQNSIAELAGALMVISDDQKVVDAAKASEAKALEELSGLLKGQSIANPEGVADRVRQSMAQKHLTHIGKLSC